MLYQIIIITISALAMFAAFPPLGIWPLGWLAFVLLFIASSKWQKMRQGFLGGLLLGLIFFSLHYSWLWTLKIYVGRLYALGGWVGIAIFESIFWAVWGFIFASVKRNDWRDMLIFPATWMCVELLRSIGIWGNSMGMIGYSQIDFHPFVYLASWLGVLGISGLLLFISGFLAYLCLNYQVIGFKYSLVRLITMLLALFVLGCFGQLGKVQTYHQLARAEQRAVVSIVQGNFGQMDKLNPQNFTRIRRYYLDKLKQVEAGSLDLMIWPETIVPTFLLERNSFRFELRQKVLKSKSDLIFGLPYREPESTEADGYFNSAVFVSSRGERMDFYRKIHLVPFGEFVPGRAIFEMFYHNKNYLNADYRPGKDLVVFPTRAGKVGIGICFESFNLFHFGNLQRLGADYLVGITNDAWFLDSFQARIHLQSVRMRAIENRRYFIQAANTGISAIVDPLGRVIHSLPLNQEGVIVGEIRY